MTARTGLIRNLAAELYHADPGSVSNTMLSTLNKSPAHCYALHIDPARPRSEPTAAMSAGSLAHTMILEPESFAARYIVKPDGIDYRTKDGKAWRDAQAGDIITAEQLATAEAQRAAILRVPALAHLLSDGVPEASVFWTDQSTGLRCRAKPDWLHWHGPTRATVLDIKTTAELTPQAVARSIASYGYHRQESHYTAGLEAVGIEVAEFVFGFVSSSYPFLAVAYVLDDETKSQGSDEIAVLLDTFAECQRTGKWPAFGDGYQSISLPAWAKQSNEVEISYV